ncbi:hypothetical protein KP509_19G069000 [Ceratopteris richardii]|uniref:Homeobox domain-containing protein n=1 Tax=Ceratopteris richardii TaxID=49495 RepID=A0A8T2SN90_CERRI|nr:hypothetical protein KP509_19G069000 [Ceratopteris richardii]
MVFHLAFEDHIRQHLLKPQMMSSSPSDQLSQMNATSLPARSSHASVLPRSLDVTHLARPSSSSENSIFMQCMQKLGHHPSPRDTRSVAQENNGEILNTCCLNKVEVGDEQHGAGGGANSSSTSSNGTTNTSGACTPRPRWCPTPEQIKVLETLFNSGTTTPTRDMIVDIASCLKQFGSIVEANVFYWFQNRKARAKRKLRIQAQLHQESAGATSISASSSPMNGEVCPAFLQGGKAMRRVCSKTSSKTSPAYNADDCLSPSLMSAHVVRSTDYHHHQPRTCGGFYMNGLKHSNHLICRSASDFLTHSRERSPQSMNSSENSCEIAPLHCSSGRSALDMLMNGCNTNGSKQHINGINQASLVPHVTTVASTIPASHDCSSHHHLLHSISQINTDPDVFGHVSYRNVSELPVSANVTSIPPVGCSALGNVASSCDAMIRSSCSPNPILQEMSYPETMSPVFQTPVSAFLTYGMHVPAPQSSPSPFATNFSSTVPHERITSFQLPAKRSWMEALMAQESVPKTNSPSLMTVTDIDTNTNYSPAPVSMQNLNGNDFQTENIATAINGIGIKKNVISPSDPSNFLGKHQQNCNQVSLLVNSNIPDFTRLAVDGDGVPAPQLDVIKGDNQHSYETTATTCTEQQHTHSSASSDVSYQLPLDVLERNQMKDHGCLESLLGNPSCTQATQVLQSDKQVASFSEICSLPRMNHHCDNLPLWEALVPYMSIGSL